LKTIKRPNLLFFVLAAGFLVISCQFLSLRGDAISITPSPEYIPSAIPPTTQNTDIVRPWKILDDVNDPITSISWSEDGNLILANKYTRDFTIWDLNTENRLPRLLINNKPINAIEGKWSPDGLTLAVLTSAYSIYLLDSDYASAIHVIETNAIIEDFDWSSDSRFLAVGVDGRIMLINAATSDVFDTINGNFNHPQKIIWSPDRTQLAISTFDGLYIWDRSKRDIIYEALLNSPIWSPDGKFVAGHFWNTLEIVNLVDGKQIVVDIPPISSFAGHQMVAWSPNGKILATAHSDSIILWDALNNYSLLGVLSEEISSEIWSLSFSADSAYLASGSSDGRLILWTIPDVILPPPSTQ